MPKKLYCFFSKRFSFLLNKDLKKILVIHSKHSQNFEYQDSLESAGFNSYITADITDGLKIAERYSPDVIICDVENFQEELGIIKQLDENYSTACIPLFLLTEVSQSNHIRAGMELGADDVLIKPINHTSLINAINKRLQKFSNIRMKITDKLISEDGAFAKKNSIQDHVLVKIGSKLKLIEFSRIICITALKEYSTITIDDRSKIIIRKSIRGWLDTLPVNDFLRIHRATIINITFLDRIEKSGFRSYNVYMKNLTKPLPISQRYNNIMRKTFSI